MPDPDPTPDPKPDPEPTPDPKPDPPVEEPFDKDRALETIRKQRESEDAAKKRAQAAEARLKEIEDRDKTEAERTAEAKTAAEKRADEAERKALQIEVALDKAPDGMPLAQVRKLAKRLTGTTKEEFESDAEELFADFKPDPIDEDDETDDTSTPRRPKEKLKPGAAPKVRPEPNDPAKLAEAVPRGW